MNDWMLCRCYEEQQAKRRRISNELAKFPSGITSEAKEYLGVLQHLPSPSPMEEQRSQDRTDYERQEIGSAADRKKQYEALRFDWDRVQRELIEVRRRIKEIKKDFEEASRARARRIARAERQLTRSSGYDQGEGDWIDFANQYSTTHLVKEEERLLIQIKEIETQISRL